MAGEFDDERAEACIRRARPEDKAQLREIAIASKAHWGYELERVRQWAAQGDFSAAELGEREIYVAEANGQAIAWAALIPKGELIWLDDLWVEPKWIGKGIGSRLFSSLVDRSKELGGERLEWEAEPNAVRFYERLGASQLRDSKPTAFGRVIPVMGLDLRGRPGS